MCGARVNVAPLLPPELSSDDVAQFMGRLPAVRRLKQSATTSRAATAASTGSGQDSLLSGTAVVSAAFAAALQALLVQYGQQVARQAQQQTKPSTATTALHDTGAVPHLAATLRMFSVHVRA